jgi:hypothetical protein
MGGLISRKYRQESVRCVASRCRSLERFAHGVRRAESDRGAKGDQGDRGDQKPKQRAGRDRQSVTGMVARAVSSVRMAKAVVSVRSETKRAALSGLKQTAKTAKNAGTLTDQQRRKTTRRSLRAKRLSAKSLRAINQNLRRRLETR